LAAGHAGRVVQRKHAQAAPPVEETNADDRPEDDHPEKIDHRCILLLLGSAIRSRVPHSPVGTGLVTGATLERIAANGITHRGR
jgi:hypothetical protein